MTNKGGEKMIDFIITIAIVGICLLFSYSVAYFLDKMDETKETRKREKWSRTIDE